MGNSAEHTWGFSASAITDGATGVPWVLAGLSLAAVAAAIAGVFL